MEYREGYEAKISVTTRRPTRLDIKKSVEGTRKRTKMIVAQQMN
jgi:hypothetical protein